MTGTIPLSFDGTTALPPGKIANVVTFLERRAPLARAPAERPGLVVRIVQNPTPDWFRPLFRQIGETWLWVSAVVASDEALAARLQPPTVVLVIEDRDGAPFGLAEIDLSVASDAEIVTFGLLPGRTGQGAGRVLMEHTLAAASSKGAARVWLHTCTFDDPAAIPFYRALGFVPFKLAVEVHDDPRLTGALSKDAAPHVALIAPPER